MKTTCLKSSLWVSVISKKSNHSVYVRQEVELLGRENKAFINLKQISIHVFCVLLLLFLLLPSMILMSWIIEKTGGEKSKRLEKWRSKTQKVEVYDAENSPLLTLVCTVVPLVKILLTPAACTTSPHATLKRA